MSMPSLEEKLQSFSAIVLEEANRQKQQKLSELEEEKNRLIDEKETELLSDAYEDIQKSVIKSRRENSERVLKVETEMKKELIMQREKIIDRVFDDVKKKLIEFTQSNEYEKWLIKRTAAAADEVGEGAKEVTVTAKDIRFKDTLEKSIKDITVVSDNGENDFIGGVTIINKDKNICVNYSISDMLAEKRISFLQESGLSIY
jgi:vacuolar-type H+-ATPase subunit E/Vma4